VHEETLEVQELLALQVLMDSLEALAFKVYLAKMEIPARKA